jgi:hypothetical protein
MKKISTLVAAVFVAGIFFGFTNSDNPKKTSYDYSGPSLEKNTVTDNNVQNPTTDGVGSIYYTDNFDLPSDSAGLAARGYLIYHRGGPRGTSPTFFQGNASVFAAFNGVATSYTAANFQAVTGTNNIDNWMVLPDMTVVTGDVISFQCRTVSPSSFPDSVTVSYNASGGTTPESAGWVELGKFNCDEAWTLKSFVAPADGFAARFAIRYKVVDGGPAGDNSDYIGIDALNVEGQGLLPVELSSFVSTVNINNVTLNWSTATETNNSGFDIERNVNGQWSKVGNVAGNGTSTVSNSYSFTDRNLASGNYSYRLKQIDFNGNFEYFNLSNEVNIGIPSKFELSQNYPNPFNPSTNLEFGISELGFVSLKIYNTSGMEVATLVNETKAAGYYTVNFNASSLSSGIYFYTLQTNNFTSTKKMMLLK